VKRTCLITGVFGGIGRATAALFAESGWEVIGVDIRTAFPDTSAHHFYKADVSDSESVHHLFTSISSDGLGVDALVNNAGVQLCKTLMETMPDEWDRVMDCNLRSVYLMSRSAIPLLSRRNGSIVNVSSVHAVATTVNMSAYAAAKGGMVALTRAMAIELAPVIRVNTVLPGAVDTAMLRNGLQRGHLPEGAPEVQLDRLAEKTALQRIGCPSEIAQAIHFLANNEKSSYITGQSIVVDGGVIARLSSE